MLHAIIAKLPMRNQHATRNFYINKLGFSSTTSIEYDGYLMLEKDNCEIHFFTHKNLDPLQNYGQIYLRINYAYDLYKYFIAQGVTIHPNGYLQAKPWGQIEFSLLDPDNNLLTFGQSNPPY